MSHVTIIRAFFILSMMLSLAATAQTRRLISGEMEGGLEAGEYIVESSIIVPPGKTLNLQPGTVLYFEQLTEINVSGSLRIEGEPASPVILTSVNDTAGSVAPAQAFDWNGVKSEGAVSLRHVHVKNSVYGVNVRTHEAEAELTGVVFQNNGYASLTRGGQVIPVTAGEPFSARWNVDDGMPSDGEPAAAAGNNPVPKKKREVKSGKSKGRLILNISAISVAAVGTAVTIASAARIDGNFKRYTEEPSEYNREKVLGNISTGAVGAAVVGVAVACIGLTLVF